MLMPDPTREAAFDLLSAVLDRHQPLEQALDELPRLDGRDRSAAHRLAAASLRRLGTIDALIEPFLTRAPPIRLRHILRLGTAGLLLGTPPHAAVATAVALARARSLAPFCPLVNAVLRRVANAYPSSLPQLDGPRLDTPAWLWSAWGRNARAIAVAHAHEAAIDLTMAPGAAAPEGGFLLPTGSHRYPAGTNVANLPGYASGAFWVQDAAAALPARLLAARPGEKIADLCAAPGGKTAQLAAAGAAVTALDRDPTRLDRLRENLDRLNLHANLVEADATSFTPAEKFDAVLLDAPCSATGTIRRHPDVAYLKRPGDVAALARQQDRLLAAAARLLRPGGRLLYAVCSLQPEEGDARIKAATTTTGLSHAPFQPDELADLPEALTAEKNFSTHPGMWPELGGMDGFFAARLIAT
jgi:16S rRNA (cytosine967-C5)-methyltransferase